MTSTSPTGTGVEVRPGAQPQGYLDPEAMLAYISERLEARLLDSVIAYGQLTIVVDPEAWVDAARLCKEDPALACDFWEFLDAVDRGEDGFDANVHLYSVTHRHEVTIRARVPGGREKPVMPTLTGLYRGANWSERETYDMFGIDFSGHPGVEPRILTIESFEGWPLRKDFQLSSRNAKPWPGAKEPEERKESDETADAGSVTAGDAPVGPEDKAAAAKAKAERAKAKAAEMRAKKAAERAEAQSAGAAPAPTADPDTTADEAAGSTPDETVSVDDQVAASDAQMATADEAKAAGDAEPGSDLIADSAERFGGGDTEGEAAAAAATAAGDPTAATPEGAAEVAGTAVAKDAAAGAAQGDMAARAPQDAPNADEPVVNPEAEAKAAQGAPPTASGTPGVEAEGRHGGDEQQSSAVPADDAPVVPAPGSATAPLDSDRSPDDAEDDRAGLRSEAVEREAQEEADAGPTSERVEEGPAPHPHASEEADAADRADPDRRMSSDDAAQDDGDQT